MKITEFSDSELLEEMQRRMTNNVRVERKPKQEEKSVLITGNMTTGTVRQLIDELRAHGAEALEQERTDQSELARKATATLVLLLEDFEHDVKANARKMLFGGALATWWSDTVDTCNALNLYPEEPIFAEASRTIEMLGEVVHGRTEGPKVEPQPVAVDAKEVKAFIERLESIARNDRLKLELRRLYFSAVSLLTLMLMRLEDGKESSVNFPVEDLQSFVDMLMYTDTKVSVQAAKFIQAMAFKIYKIEIKTKVKEYAAKEKSDPTLTKGSSKFRLIKFRPEGEMQLRFGTHFLEIEASIDSDGKTHASLAALEPVDSDTWHTYIFTHVRSDTERSPGAYLGRYFDKEWVYVFAHSTWTHV